MSAGQAAYEAFYAPFGGANFDFDDAPAMLRGAWEAAAQAAIDHDQLHHGNLLTEESA